MRSFIGVVWGLLTIAGCTQVVPYVTCEDQSICPPDHKCVPNVEGTEFACVLVGDYCGDGKVTPLIEVCDPAAVTDTICPTGVTPCTELCRIDPRCGKCGNGIVETGEACDDGNNSDGDGCSANCSSTEACGNAITDAAVGEECDNGDLLNSDTVADACRRNCKKRFCGDAVVDLGSGESCDLGPLNGTDPLCSADCKAPLCGDGIVQAITGEACDLGAANSNAPNAACRPNCQPQRCADGVLDAGEVCDDGNLVSADGCAGDCLSLETCGNGRVDYAKGEECDDNNTIANDGCSAACKVERCGDSVAQSNEGCDQGAANSNAPDAACRVNCQPQRCGDGVLDTGEVCDDGNVVSNDGCAGSCLSRETCGNGIVDVPTGEECDDGNATNNDTCSNSCRFMRCGDGIVQAANNEGCDNAGSNANTPDAACRLNCQPKRCGDAVRDTGEVCDDGNVLTGDGCSGDCRSNETCGNDYIDAVRGEQCDSGLDGLAADGCTFAGCQLEPANWAERNFASKARMSAAITYDSTRQALVIFGGAYSFNGLTNDLQEWNGVQLRTIPPSGTWPFERRAPGLAYDPNAQRTVMFGGFDASFYSRNNQTWLWDGARWELRDPATKPPPRQRPSMVWDPLTNRVLLFGGYGGALPSSGPDTATDLADTWLWDGTTWTQRNPGVSPTPRSSAGLAYDAARGKVVLFGGLGASGYLNDTWLWDGTTWQLQAPSTRPTARAVQLTYDANRQRVVLFGGAVAGVDSGNDETWEWTGSNWELMSPTVKPLSRRDHMLAYFPPGQNTVLLGGIRGNGSSNDAIDDLWSWSGPLTNMWAPLDKSVTPPARSEGAMAYDPVRGKIVLVGGRSGAGNNANLAGVWELDETGWVGKKPTVQPANRIGGALAFDPITRTLLLHGGRTQHVGGYLDDTWQWNGTTWTQLSPATVPSPSSGSGLCAGWYSHGNTLIMVRYGKTWRWSGSNWIDVTPAVGQPNISTADCTLTDSPANGQLLLTWARGGATWNGSAWASTSVPAAVSANNAVGAYHAAHNRPIFFGGLVFPDTLDSANTWERTVQNEWLAVPVATTPPARYISHMAYDARRHKAVVFGGRTWLNIMYGDTWEFGYSHAAQLPDTCGATDTDGDGLVGCADPDCFARCTPLCPPYSIAPACLSNTSASRCGDGVCNAALETNALCPSDCP